MTGPLARVDEALRGRYQSIRELDVQGRAHVLLARDLQHGRNVALKVVVAEHAGDAAVADFLDANRAAAELHHPNILALLDFGEADGLAFSVLPFVEGASLADRLRAGPVDVEEGLSIAIEIGEALEHAHSRGVLHGALRPENVMLSAGHAELSFSDARKLTDNAAVDIAGLARLVREMLPADHVSPELARVLDRATAGQRRRYHSIGDFVGALRWQVPEPLLDLPVGRRGLVEELKRRKVIGSALLYAGAALALVEGGGPFASSLGLPDWTQDYLARLALFGFPLALVLAWAFDITTTGIRLTEPRLTASANAGSRRAARARRMGAVGLAAIVFVAGGFLSWGGEHAAGGGDGRPGLDPARIAVLEFEREEGTAELDGLADNLHERIVERLSGIESLNVVSTLGVRRWDGVLIDSIARALQAGTIIRSTLDATDDSIRVVLHVMNGENGVSLGAHSMWAARPQQFRLIDEVGDAVSDLLRHELGQSVSRRQWQRESENQAAQDRFLWAEQRLAELHAFMHTNDLAAAARTLVEADSLFAEAERLDRLWARPALSRATVAGHGRMVAVASGTDPMQPLRDGVAVIDRALVRMPGQPELLYARASLHIQVWQGTGGSDSLLANQIERDLRSAIDEHPIRARVYEALARLLGPQERYEEALQYAEWAYEQDPFLDRLPANLQRLFELNFQLKRDAQAAAWCDEGRRRMAGSPQQRLFHHCALHLMAWTEVVPADVDSAWVLMSAALDGYPPGLVSTLEPNMRGLVAGVLARAALPDSALRVLEPLRTVNPPRLDTAVPVAAVFTRLDRADEAVAVLLRLLEVSPGARAQVMRSRELEPLFARPDVMQPLRLRDR